MNTVAGRKPYQGLLQILRFNRRAYLGTLAGVGLTMLASPFLPPMERAVLAVGVAPLLFWMASSLIVSHYVYDRFPLYDLNWIARTLRRMPRRWINIHCGLDETSGLLTALFPETAGETADIFDAQVMTEPSIRVARRLTRCAIPAAAARYDALAFNAGTFDAAFAIFAAHELRRHDQRVKLFREIARILTPVGDFVLVEHSRDLWNFIAFGPGCLHFFSKRAWRKAACDAGMTVRTEFSMTPFVHVYSLRRAK